MQEPRTAQQIIDQAIAENRFGERLLYGFAITFVLTGVVGVIAGILLREGVVAVAGSIASVLFWPAMREARQIRKENMAIRLLEAPLDKAETSIEAAEAVQEFFQSVLVRQKQKGNA